MSDVRECRECGLGFDGSHQPEGYSSRYYCGPLCQDAYEAGLEFTSWGNLGEAAPVDTRPMAMRQGDDDAAMKAEAYEWGRSQQ